MQKKLSNIFVAGAGSISEVKRTTIRSEKLRRNRAITVAGKKFRELKKVDNPTVFDVEKAIAKTFKGKPPLSFMAKQNCATKALLEAAPESQKVIFASYLSNNLSENDRSCVSKTHSCFDTFFKAAKSRLVPGGRLVLVQDKGDIPAYKKDATRFGFEFHAVDIPENVAKRSSAVYIRARSTPKRRIAFIKANYGSTHQMITKYLIKDGVIKSEEECAKPVLMFLKKPRNGRPGDSQFPNELIKEVEQMLARL